MRSPKAVLPPDTDLVRWLADLPPDLRARAIAMLDVTESRSLYDDWPGWSHDGQRPPDSRSWRTWALIAGRGFGKTRAGSQWIAEAAARDGTHRIALVGATIEDARMVMVEGVSGLIAVAGPAIAEWRPSIGRLTFTNGAEAMLYSGSAPEKLRGPEHILAWCDELAKWPRARATWDMLQLGLRLGPDPRALVTTTPRQCDTLEAILADPATVTTHGPTWVNPFLPDAFIDAMKRQYGGTRLADQELEGRMPVTRPGQLFTRDLLAKCRINPNGPLAGEQMHRAQGREYEVITRQREEMRTRSASGSASPNPTDVTNSLRDATPPIWTPTNLDPFIHNPPSTDGDLRTPWPPDWELDGIWPIPERRPVVPRRFRRLAIGVDPPVAGGTCGIIVAALDDEGYGHVLEDASVSGASPERWARAVADAFARWHREAAEAMIVAEVNQGGDMVATVLKQADPALAKAIRPVRAARAKATRAEPVALLFEQRRVRLHGRFEQLEHELLRLGTDERGPSPDRADAMVWAVGELMLKPKAEPSVRWL